MPTKITRPDGKPIVCGDDFRLDVTVTNIPDGRTFSKSWFTVKRDAADLDADAVLQITTTGPFTISSGTLTYSIDVTDGQCLLLTPGIKRKCDIQLLDSTGAITTPLSDGEIVTTAQITIATS